MDLSFENVTISSEQGVRAVDVEGVRFSGATIAPNHGPAFRFEGASAKLERSCTPPGVCLELTGEKNAIELDGAPFSGSAGGQVSSSPPPLP